jgi:hypothetical protein
MSCSRGWGVEKRGWGPQIGWGCLSAVVGRGVPLECPWPLKPNERDTFGIFDRVRLGRLSAGMPWRAETAADMRSGRLVGHLLT